jgi:hypothetical protein
MQHAGVVLPLLFGKRPEDFSHYFVKRLSIHDEQARYDKNL